MDELKEFGLNKYEIDAYLALIREGERTAHIISQKSSVPYGKIYSVLYSLEEKGFVNVSSSTPRKFKAVEPKKAITQCVKNRELEFSLYKKEASKLLTHLGKLSSRKEEPLEKIRIIKGYKNVIHLSEVVHRKVKHEFLSISRLPLYQPYIDDYKEGIRLGVDIKLIACAPELERENLNAWKDINANIRIVDYMQTRFNVIDGKEVVMRFSGGKKYFALWIQNQSYAESMREYFLKLWKNAKRI